MSAQSRLFEEKKPYSFLGLSLCAAQCDTGVKAEHTVLPSALHRAGTAAFSLTCQLVFQVNLGPRGRVPSQPHQPAC